MRKKLLIGVAVSALLVAVLGGVALALGPWGEATEKPPCAEWRDRVFDKKTGKINLYARNDEDGNPVGFSLTAARGLLDEGSCKWVFRPSGDKKDVYWNKRYRLEAMYDIAAAAQALHYHRLFDLNGIVHVANEDFDQIVNYDEQCVKVGGEVWHSAVSGMEWCNLPSSEGEIEGGLNQEDGDYTIRGPR